MSAGLSVFLGAWGLLAVGFPFASIGGAAAGGFGLVFGVLALLSGACGRWQRAALLGIALACLILVVFAVLLVASLGAS